MHEDRRLAAIMFTDIVGYTALMGSDEEKAFKILRKNREIQRPIVKKFRGEWLKEMGDGILASFQTASDAVRCAVSIQQSVKKEGIGLRIGIHEGEVVFEGGDVLGDGVNVASRLEELADKGCINISGAVYKDIRNKAGINTEFLEEKKLKNVEDPVKIYRVYSKGVEEKAQENSPVNARLRSIAVLPFVNMSNDPEQEYFCDGMSEEIINALSHLESLKVIARTSAFMFKGKNEDIRDIGKKLDVETLLEGSVRKSGNRLRITAQLIKTSDGAHLWSERYDRDIEDVFAIQDEISLSIVDNLKVKLLGKQKQAIVKRYTDNIEANIHYLKGRRSRQRKDTEGFYDALEYHNKAIKLDPDFALAYADIAFTYVLMGWFCQILINNELKEKILFNAEKALKLDKNVSEAYIALALAWELIEQDQIKAEEYARKAVELNPGDSEVIQEHGFILARMGRFEEAMQKMETTLQIDPLSINAYNGIGHVLFYNGSFSAAITQFQNILILNPSFYPALITLSLSLTEIGKLDEALQEIKKCTPKNPQSISQMGYLMGKMGETSQAQECIDEIKNNFFENPQSEFLVGLVYVGMNELNKAFDWFKRSQDKYGFVYRDKTIGHDFRLKNVRKDPRFADLKFN